MTLSKKDLQKISENIFEIPSSFSQKMYVPARIYASERLLEKIFQDRTLAQLVNTASLPGIFKYALAMPDAHEGFGPPIGGVFATKIPKGIIAPGGIGYDINCGTRLLISSITFSQIQPYIKELIDAFFIKIPSGVGARGPIVLSASDFKEVLKEGAGWAVKKGYGSSEDLKYCESNGKIPEADPSCVSEKAKQRGKDQLGTLGSGNHFLEVQKVEQIYDQEIAQAFGLFPEQITILIHSGSRGLGHQVCTDYVNLMREAVKKYKIKIPDPELACAPFDSKEGQQYFKAMAAAANFAWANRQCLMYFAQKVWQKVLSGKFKNLQLRLVYDVAHNIAKVEEHNGVKLCVHRKGATRAFPPGHPELPEAYQKIGQPVLIPGSMGTASYVLAGTETGKESFYSTCHGAGRTMSRAAAKKMTRGEAVQSDLEKRGIYVRSGSKAGIAEEAPIAYKDIDEVVKVVEKTGLAKKVARLTPLGVIKG